MAGTFIIRQEYFRVQNSSYRNAGYWPPAPILKVHISVTNIVFPITSY